MDQNSIENETKDKKMSKSKQLLIVVGLFILIGASEGISYVNQKSKSEQRVINYFSDTSMWKDFNSTLGNFQVSFPIYPDHDTQHINIPGLSSPLDMEMYFAEKPSGVSYFVMFATYPNQIDTSVPENNLEGAVNGMLQSTESNLISSRFTNFGLHRAIEYLLFKKNGSKYIKGKNILVGQTMYQIVVSYEPASSSSVDFDKFANSFKLH